jgi:predicted enzyme related to lactoylglutathione lyase
MKNLVNWVEIPATNLERAKKFYSMILGVEFFDMSLGDLHYSIFPSQDGALVSGADRKPSKSGALVYLNGGNDLSQSLAKVAGAGGVVLLGKTFLTKEAGHIGIFLDSEGNKMAFHSMT